MHSKHCFKHDHFELTIFLFHLRHKIQIAITMYLVNHCLSDQKAIMSFPKLSRFEQSKPFHFGTQNASMICLKSYERDYYSKAMIYPKN